MDTSDSHRFVLPFQLKQESLNISTSNLSFDSDWDASFWSDETEPTNLNITYISEPKTTCPEKEEKKEEPKEEKPILHRKTATISVQNFRRRRLLSQKSMRPPITWLNRSIANNSNDWQNMSVDTLPINVAVPIVDDEIMAQPTHTTQLEIAPVNIAPLENAPVNTTPLEIAPVPNHFCGVCVQNYTSRAGLMKHIKTQKHRNNLQHSMR